MTDNPDLSAYNAMALTGRFSTIFVPGPYRIQGVEPPKYATKEPGEPVTFMDYTRNHDNNNLYLCLMFKKIAYHELTVTSPLNQLLSCNMLLAYGEQVPGERKFSVNETVMLRYNMRILNFKFSAGQLCTIVKIDTEIPTNVGGRLEVIRAHLAQYQIRIGFTDPTERVLWYEVDPIRIDA